MPFSIRHTTGGRFQVVTARTGKVHGTFHSKEAARRQVRAMYANKADKR